MKTLIEKINEDLKKEFTERNIYFSETIDLSKLTIHITERNFRYSDKDVTIRLRWFSPPKKGDKGTIIWNFFNLDEDHLCKCNKCDNILIDKNPQVDAKKFQLKGNEKELINVNNEFWGCPECLTDDYLIDL